MSAPCGEAPADIDGWDAGQYLQHYYTRLEADEVATLDFIARACRRIERPGCALAFGVGPTVHHLLPLAPRARELHVADYLESNLEHVRAWLRADARAHDWRRFTRHVLRCEGSAPDASAIAQRERLVRARVTHCLRADAGREQPLFAPVRARYDVVLSCYCAESATGERAVWRRYLRHIVQLLAPGGLFITAALRRCSAYRVGPQRFACADIDEHDLAAALLESGLQRDNLQIEVRHVGLRQRLGYDSVILAAATRPAPRQHAAAAPDITAFRPDRTVHATARGSRNPARPSIHEREAEGRLSVRSR